MEYIKKFTKVFFIIYKMVFIEKKNLENVLKKVKIMVHWKTIFKFSFSKMENVFAFRQFHEDVLSPSKVESFIKQFTNFSSCNINIYFNFC